VGASAQPGGQKAAGFVPAGGAAALAGHVAVTGVDLDGRATDADTQFDDPFRWPGPTEPAVFFLGLPLQQGSDLGVDAPQPHGVPYPQSAETV
jgi:hypothetical protein